MSSPAEKGPELEKSQFSGNEILHYCVEHSFKLKPIQEKLMKDTLQYPMGKMMGAVEVIQLCSSFMEQINAKNVLDVGLFTGFSALSWALVIPADGHVVTMDVSDQAYKDVGKKYVEESGLSKKIDVRIQPALKTLDDLITSGKSGQFDFAFIDADKSEYPEYYEKCMQLLRPGGFIAVDNALGPMHRKHGDHRPPPPPQNGGIVPFTKHGPPRIDELNKIIANDKRVNNVLLPIADGLNLVFKK